MSRRGHFAPRDVGTRLGMDSNWYTIRLLEIKDDSEWTLLYIPDNAEDEDIFYLMSHCRCGGLQLRFVIGYSKLITPGLNRSNYGLHEVGEGMTRTPKLNVLRNENMIKGIRVGQGSVYVFT